MNKNQIQGESKIIAGKVQEKVGKIFGNKQQQLKGTGKQFAGNFQKSKGNIQQAADDLADNIGNK